MERTQNVKKKKSEYFFLTWSVGQSHSFGSGLEVILVISRFAYASGVHREGRGLSRADPSAGQFFYHPLSIPDAEILIFSDLSGLL